MVGNGMFKEEHSMRELLELKLSKKIWPYSTACGTLFPRQVIEPTSPALEGRVNHWTTREA